MPDDPIEPAPPPDDYSHGPQTPEDTPTLPGEESVPPKTVLMGGNAGAVFPLAQSATVIGRYKLLKELGKGGFGMVWQAEQTEPIRREVALKIIKPGMDSQEIIARFEAERQTLALMDHPNIAAVLDAGTTERGLPYFVMELVNGVPITEYCDTYKLDIRARLALFIPVCQAVQHAHQKSILHRDLKPSNILVTEVDGQPVPKVIDFGIAKALGTSAEAVLQASILQTQAGAVIGTPQYMSPEQAGAGADLDTRSDIYTLGVILYELLTGMTPLPREALQNAALDEVLRLIREADPVRPSSRLMPVTDLVRRTSTARNTDPRKLNRALRGDLDWITLKALEKERERRYESAAALALDIERHLKDEVVAAGPPSGLYRLRKLVRRNRLAVGAGVSIFAVLLAGIGVSEWQRRAAVWQRQVAEEQKREAFRQRQIAEEQRTKADEQRREALRQSQVAEEQRTKAVAASTQTSETLSKSDYFEALRSIGEGRGRDALAQLSRSITLDPHNEAAVCRLTTLLEYHNFPLPVLRLEHPEGVLSGQFSPDGKQILTTCNDMSARVWDAQSGQLMSGPFKHEGEIRSAEFSPDGKRVVTASDDKTARVWNALNGQPLGEPLKHEREVFSAEFSPDGERVVTAADGVRVWDTATGTLAFRPENVGDFAYSAEFSPDGKLIATAAEFASILNAKNGKPVIPLIQGGASVSWAQFSPDGKRLLGIPGWSLGVWSVKTGKQLIKEFAVEGEILSAQWSPDGKRIATGTNDEDAWIWNSENGARLAGPMEHDGSVWSVRFSPDGKRIVTGSVDKTARIWDAKSGVSLSEPLAHDGIVWSAHFSPDDRWVLTSSGDKSAQLWDVRNGQALTEPLKHAEAITSVRFSPDGERIASASKDGKVRIWDAASGGLITEYSAHQAGVNAAEFSPDGERIVTASGDNTAQIFAARDGALLAPPLKHAEPVLVASFSPDGSRVVTASGKTANIWNAETGEHLAAVGKTAQFSPDGKHIVVVSDEKSVRVLDAKSFHPVTDPLTHDGLVEQARFIADGERIVTVCEDRSIRVWNSRSGKLVSGPWKAVIRSANVYLSADATRLMAMDNGEDAKAIHLWDVATNNLFSEPIKRGWMRFGRFSPDGRLIVTVSLPITDSPPSTEHTEITVWDVQTGKPLTDSLELEKGVNSADLSADGKWLVTGSEDGTVRAWSISPRRLPPPEWLPRLAEVIAGQRLNDRGVFEALNKPAVQVLEEIRQELGRESGEDDWKIWGRWFTGDRSKRTISPFSDLTVPAYIENRIKENTPTSLSEAERLGIGNAEFLDRIVKARRKIAK